jgi:hypothetical protein
VTFRRLSALLAATIGGCALAPAATAIPFGANLNRPANNPFPCAINPVLGIPWLAGTPQSCSWAGAGRLGDFSETFNVPAGRGVLTSASVRVGPQTGPVQVGVVRSLRDPRSTALPVCCIVQFTSTPFTPAPNAVTTVPLPNVPVVNDRVLEPGLQALRFDTIVLSVLAPNVPVPAHATGDQNDAAFGLYPAIAAGQERFEGTTALPGLVPLLRAEWVPTAEPGSGLAPPASAPPPPGVTPAPSDLRLPASVAAVRSGVVPIVLACGGDARCVGQVLLQNRRRAGQAQSATPRRRPAPLVTYGRATFTIAPGARGTVRISLNRRGKALVAGAPRRAVWANASLTGASPLARSWRLTLRR